MALCWTGTVMAFFTLSTTQEYYSMPIYPALALLIGSALASSGSTVQIGKKILLGVFAVLFVLLAGVLVAVWRSPAPGDISAALTQNPEAYTLSLGHVRDLTLQAFAYLKLPLALAAGAFGFGAAALTFLRRRRLVVLAVASVMVIFFQATHAALVRFDSYLGSYPLAEALEKSPPGQLIEADAYYAFSSVFFYSNRPALLLNGRVNNLEYGSYAPDAPPVFIGDSTFRSLWGGSQRIYLLSYGSDLPHLEQLVGRANLHVVRENSGNCLLTNQALP
jgi:hypothetical protein